MIRHRLFLHGDFSSENYSKFSRKILRVLDLVRDEKQEMGIQAPKRRIVIDLTSDGGDLYSALACASLIRNAGKQIPVSIIARGMIASASVVVLASGTTRSIAKESWVMLHESSMSEYSGNLSEITIEAKHLENLEKQFSEILAERTKVDYNKWRELHKGVTYLSSKDCLELGLVDKII